MWGEEPSAKVLQTNIEAWCAKIEKVIIEQRLDSVHLQQIQDILHIDYAYAGKICNVLEGRGLLGPDTMKTGHRQVLVRPLIVDWRQDYLIP